MMEVNCWLPIMPHCDTPAQFPSYAALPGSSASGRGQLQVPHTPYPLIMANPMMALSSVQQTHEPTSRNTAGRGDASQTWIKALTPALYKVWPPKDTQDMSILSKLPFLLGPARLQSGQIESANLCLTTYKGQGTSIKSNQNGFPHQKFLYHTLQLKCHLEIVISRKPQVQTRQHKPTCSDIGPTNKDQPTQKAGCNESPCKHSIPVLSHGCQKKTPVPIQGNLHYQ